MLSLSLSPSPSKLKGSAPHPLLATKSQNSFPSLVSVLCSFTASPPRNARQTVFRDTVQSCLRKKKRRKKASANKPTELKKKMRNGVLCARTGVCGARSVEKLRFAERNSPPCRLAFVRVFFTSAWSLASLIFRFRGAVLRLRTCSGGAL